MKKCPYCAEEIQDDAIKCKHCNEFLNRSSNGNGITPGIPLSSTDNRSSISTDFSKLPEYYQNEFKKIYESNETYKGKWNWAAFLFGAFWALKKRVWLASLIAFGISILTGGFAALIYWFVFGFRGNFMYYSAFGKNKQLII